MKVGLTLWFQNLPDFYERGKSDDYSRPIPVSDSQIYQDELHLADLAEPLGFDSLWTIEHHFGAYGLNTNPLQLFSYMAGRTTKIEFGTMVVVLPWHDPLRVAEGIAVLDQFTRGRKMNIGFGRGAAPQEFEAFGVDYATSRERMAESFDIIRTALTQEFFSYKGKHFDIPETSIRPRPITEDLTKSMLLAWSSPETMEWAANTGAGQLFSNFSNWSKVADTSDRFNAVRAAHGWHPVSPTAGGPVFVSTDRDEIESAREWYKQTVDSSMWHYGLFNQPSMRARLQGLEGKALQEEVDAIFEESSKIGIFGTPDEVTERLVDIQSKTGLGHLVAHLKFGLMPVEVAEKSMRLFAKEVMPTLQAIEVNTTEATSVLDVVAAGAVDNVRLAADSDNSSNFGVAIESSH